MMDAYTIENRFKYHPPQHSQVEKYGTLRDRAREMAHLINELCPDSNEKNIAMTRLEESIMHANASIARHGAVK